KQAEAWQTAATPLAVPPFCPGGILLQQANPTSPRTFRTGFGLERHPLAPAKGVEVRDGTPVEEVLLSVLPRDEAKAAIGHDLLDGPLCHLFPQVPRETDARARSRNRPKHDHGEHRWRPAALTAYVSQDPPVRALSGPSADLIPG